MLVHVHRRVFKLKMQIRIVYLLLILSFFNLANSRTLSYLSNIKQNSPGKMKELKHYVTLANDPKSSLPKSFTVCSSVLIKFTDSVTNVFTFLKQDGSAWFEIDIPTKMRMYQTLSEQILVWYENPVTREQGREYFIDTILPIVPHSWYHLCLGLDTVSGLLRIVVNGRLVVNEEKEYFKDTTESKPASVEGKILIFKGYHAGFWYQHWGTVSNLNIFSSMMSLDDMEKRTSGGEDCYSPGDYLQ